MPKATRRPSKVFGTQMGAVRARRRWSLQDLADRLARLGFPMDRTTLNRIENGRRGLSLDEALAVAAALDVCPLHLVIPLTDMDRVQIAPKVVVGAIRARKWMRGDHPLPDQNAQTFGDEVPLREKIARQNTSLTMVKQLMDNEMYRPRPDNARLIETLELSAKALRLQEQARKSAQVKRRK